MMTMNLRTKRALVIQLGKKPYVWHRLQRSKTLPFITMISVAGMRIHAGSVSKSSTFMQSSPVIVAGQPCSSRCGVAFQEVGTLGCPPIGCGPPTGSPIARQRSERYSFAFDLLSEVRA